VLDDYYLNYLLGVLMEQDDVLLVVFEKNGEVEVRHTISKQTYDDVGLVALQDQYEDKLSIQLNLDVACKFLGDGRPKEVCRFTALTGFHPAAPGLTTPPSCSALPVPVLLVQRPHVGNPERHLEQRSSRTRLA
jgi:hypothetical protein